MLYSIDFVGHWPVGAVAVVEANTEEAAKDLFLLQLTKEEPCLIEQNPREDIVITKLYLDKVPCVILLNGDY